MEMEAIDPQLRPSRFLILAAEPVTIVLSSWSWKWDNKNADPPATRRNALVAYSFARMEATVLYISSSEKASKQANYSTK